MNKITTPQPDGALPLQQAEQMLGSLPGLRGQYPKTEGEAKQLAEAVDALAKPAAPRWIAQRIATLLQHYFTTDTHPAALESMARDWIAELREQPQWAIEKACAWWLSKNNLKRRNKPMPGDIAESADTFTSAVRLGGMIVGRYARYGDTPPKAYGASPAPTRRQELSPDDIEQRKAFAAQVLQEFGYQRVSKGKTYDDEADALAAATQDAADYGAGWLMVDQGGRVSHVSPPAVVQWAKEREA